MILGELIEKLGGNLIQGDPEWIVESVNSCERASPFDLAFADSPDSTTAALSGHAGVVVLKPGAECAERSGEAQGPDRVGIHDSLLCSMRRVNHSRSASGLRRASARLGIEHARSEMPRREQLQAW